MITSNDEKVYAKSNAKDLIVVGVSAAAVGLTFIEVPAMAQTSNDAVTDINAMVTSLGTIAAGTTTVVLGAMIVRLGIKFVNRMTVKG